MLLDRDGTINVDHGYVGSIDQVEFIDGSIDAIRRLNEAGIPVAVVSNQAGVARGLYGIDDVQQVHKHMIAELARGGARVDMWLYCPYHPDGIVDAFARVSNDRKPAPGMALAAAQTLDLDLSASWVIGDRDSDVGLARAVGATPLFIGTPSESGVATYPDLATAVAAILSDDPPRAAAPRFPSHRFERAETFGRAYAEELARAFATVDLTPVHDAAEVLLEAYQSDAAVFACGNGGSASIANHLQCDHVKGVGNGTDLTNRVYSLSTNVEIFSAIANDLGYEHVFTHQLQTQARPGDVLVAVSSSGSSANIVRAVDWANEHGMRTIALTGFRGGAARERATVSIHVDAVNYGVIEDAHQALMHLLAQYVRQSRMSPEAVASQVF